MAGQLKKLFYNKRFIDSPDGNAIAEWKIAPWKVFGISLALIVLLIVVYGWFFTANKQDFFGNVIFYAIVIVLAIVGIWIAGKKAMDFKQRITYFLIAFILIWVFYWVLSLLFSYAGMLSFYMGGPALWTIISLLSFLGAKRIDGELDKNDIFFGCLVLLVILGANIPMNATGGFLANVDAIINKVMSLI